MTTPSGIQLVPPLQTPGVGLESIRIETPNLIGFLKSEGLFNGYFSDPKNILGTTTSLLSIGSGVQNWFGDRFLNPLYEKNRTFAVFARMFELGIYIPYSSTIGFLNHEMGHLVEDKVFGQTRRAALEREIAEQQTTAILTPEAILKRLACKPKTPFITFENPFTAYTTFSCRYDTSSFPATGGLNQNALLSEELWRQQHLASVFTPQMGLSSLLAYLQLPIYTLKTRQEVPKNEIGLRRKEEVNLIPGSHLLPPELNGNDIYSFTEYGRRLGSPIHTQDILFASLWNLGNVGIYESIRCGIDFISKGKRECKPLAFKIGSALLTPPHLETFLVATPQYDGFTNGLRLLLMDKSAGNFEFAYQGFFGANRGATPLTTQEVWDQAGAKGPRIKYQASRVEVGYSKSIYSQHIGTPAILLNLGIATYFPSLIELFGITSKVGVSIFPHRSVGLNLDFQYTNGKDPLNFSIASGDHFFQGRLSLTFRPFSR